MPAININSSNFEEVVMNADKPVLVDFWASWCGPCRVQSPVMEELADELEGSVVIAKLNVDEDSAIAEQFSIMSIPTLLLFKDGKLIDRKTGVTSKDALLSLVNSVNA